MTRNEDGNAAHPLPLSRAYRSGSPMLLGALQAASRAAAGEQQRWPTQEQIQAQTCYLKHQVNPSEQIICSKQPSSANRASACGSRVAVRLLSEFNSINYHFHWFTLRSDKQHWKFNPCCLLLSDQINHPPGPAANPPGPTRARLSVHLHRAPRGAATPHGRQPALTPRSQGEQEEKDGAQPKSPNKASKRLKKTQTTKSF